MASFLMAKRRIVNISVPFENPTQGHGTDPHGVKESYFPSVTELVLVINGIDHNFLLDDGYQPLSKLRGDTLGQPTLVIRLVESPPLLHSHTGGLEESWSS